MVILWILGKTSGGAFISENYIELKLSFSNYPGFKFENIELNR